MERHIQNDIRTTAMLACAQNGGHTADWYGCDIRLWPPPSFKDSFFIAIKTQWKDFYLTQTGNLSSYRA